MAPVSPLLTSPESLPIGQAVIVQSGISLTLAYGSDHLTCEALIEPPQALFHREETARFMSPVAVMKTLEAIAPQSERGKEINRMITEVGCNEFQVLEYENVTITHSMHNCLPLKPERETRATVSFRRTSCRSLPKS